MPNIRDSRRRKVDTERSFTSNFCPSPSPCALGWPISEQLPFNWPLASPLSRQLRRGIGWDGPISHAAGARISGGMWVRFRASGGALTPCPRHTGLIAHAISGSVEHAHAPPIPLGTSRPPCWRREPQPAANLAACGLRNTAQRLASQQERACESTSTSGLRSLVHQMPGHRGQLDRRTAYCGM